MKEERMSKGVPAPEKVERLYEAVRVLLEEGKKVNTMTVSEITEKAGIGKGTAYEYFKSKEEMIARAILYEREKSIWEIEERASALPTFYQKFLEILKWMEEIHGGGGSAAIFRHIAQESMQFSDEVKEEILKFGCDPEFVFGTIKKFLNDWKKEGDLVSNLPEELQCCMMISNFAAFWLYLNRNPQADEAEREKVKEYLYRCLLSNLAEAG